MNAPHGLAVLAAAAALVLAMPTAQAQVAKVQPVIGEKIDSGLGALPPYASWDDPTGRQPMRHRVAGESLDDGLGELPPYSQWLDRSGRDPMRRDTLSARVSAR
jgi:hypothetical protein